MMMMRTLEWFLSPFSAAAFATFARHKAKLRRAWAAPRIEVTHLLRQSEASKK